MDRKLTPGWLGALMILGPLLAVLVLELIRRLALPDFFNSWAGFVVLMAIWFAGIYLFTRFIVGEIDQKQRILLQQNEELLALHHASLAIESQLDLEVVLHRVVEEARHLLGVRFGGLTFFHEDGELAKFITAGIPDEERARMQDPPKGHGVIGAVTQSGGTLRLDDVAHHPQSVGFPENHPKMGPLLAVPILSKGGVFGHLYLADMPGKQFTERDEETLVRFAALSAVAIENAQLHQQVRALAITEERERIAREMHDSLAQVLGYVNTKAQATKVLMKNGKVEKATEQLDQMASAARDAYADVREGILSLRTSLEPDRTLVDTLREYLGVWEEQSGVRATLDASQLPDRALTDLEEVHLLRITQEALANVRKHAGASEVAITMERTGQDVITTIVDNGSGFVQEERGARGVPQFGMSTMRERAESLGGSFDVSSILGEGTSIRVRLPAGRLD